MNNLTLSWTLPTKRIDGRALPIDQIDYVRIEMRVVGAPNFTLVDDFSPTEVSTVFEDIDFGEYEFRGTVVDTDGRIAAPRVITALVMAPPEGLSSLVATVETT